MRVSPGARWRALGLGLPALFAIVFYWRTLGIWFRADDFAWLGLRLSIATPRDLLLALFEPRAQGTVRFLSERAFFLTFETLFGLNSLPFRIFVLGLYAGAVALLAAVTQRVTGSRPASLLTPVLWTISVGVAAAIGWMSSTNQIFFSFFLLLAFWSFLTHRTGWSWAAYLLGFGTLESMVTLPALLLGYAWAFDRPRLRAAAWYLIPAAIFTALHLAVIPKVETDAAYRMHFSPADLGLAAGTYWTWASGSMVAAIVLGIYLVVVVSWRARRGDWAPAFGLFWFFAVLGPVLPLRDHLLHYYLAAPAMGLALALASAAVAGGPVWRGVGLVAIGLYTASHVPRSREAVEWHRGKARNVRTLVRGVTEARRLHPASAILLTGVSNELFWDGIYDNPFRILGVDRVYLAPGSERAIDEHPEWGGISRWTIPEATVREMFRTGSAVVYEPGDGRLANVTSKWRERAVRLGEGLTGYVNVGEPAYERQLLSGWEDIYNGTRWMGARAKVSVSMAAAKSRELILSGWGPAALLEGGPVDVEVLVDGVSLGKQPVREPGAAFELIYRLPAGKAGLPQAEVEIRAGRTVRPPEDGRDLSFVFGTIQIR